MNGFRRFARSTLMWPLVALAAIILFNLIFTSGFFRIEVKDGHLFGSLVDILKRSAPTMIIALGMTLVIATKGIDISVGSIAAIAVAVAGIMITKVHAPLALVIVAPLVAAVLCGVFNGLLVAAFDIQPIITTLILMVTGRGIGLLIIGGRVVLWRMPSFEFLGSGYVMGVAFPIIIAAVLFAALFAFLKLNPLGLFIPAIGGNPEASRYSGLRVKRVKFIVYAFSGFCAGIAGLILSADIKASDVSLIGMYIELDAILAVVIGGTSMNGGKFSLGGTIIGALIIQSLTTTILMRGIPVQYPFVVKAFVVILVILLQSEEFRKKFKRIAPKQRIAG
jgi:galactofuranose transport system permease protein